MVLEVPMWVKGRTNVSALQSWLEVVALVPLLVIGITWYGIEAAAMSRALVAAVMLPMMMSLASRYCGIGFGELARVVWRPLLSAIVMAACLAALPSGNGHVFALFGKAALGSVVYVSILLLSWALSGRPDGIERIVMGRLIKVARNAA
jgi:O-antigen/teichoic acid export membrane protein